MWVFEPVFILQNTSKGQWFMENMKKNPTSYLINQYDTLNKLDMLMDARDLVYNYLATITQQMITYGTTGKQHHYTNQLIHLSDTTWMPMCHIWCGAYCAYQYSENKVKQTLWHQFINFNQHQEAPRMKYWFWWIVWFIQLCIIVVTLLNPIT